jgi:hypothetical protein
MCPHFGPYPGPCRVTRGEYFNGMRVDADNREVPASIGVTLHDDCRPEMKPPAR